MRHWQCPRNILGKQSFDGAADLSINVCGVENGVKDGSDQVK